MKHKLITLIALIFGLCAPFAAHAAVTFDAAKEYTIKNTDCGLYLSLQASSAYTESSSANATPLVTTPTYFTLTQSSGKYSFKSGNLYMALSTSTYSGWNTKSQSSASSIWTIEETETPGRYHIKSSKGYLKYDGKNKYAYTNGTASEKVTWEIEEKASFATSIEDGKYYRIHNYSYAGRYLTEDYTNSGAITGATQAEATSPYAQIWQLNKTAEVGGAEGKYKLKNAMTGRAIASQSTQSSQFKTSASGYAFVVQRGTSGGNSYFTFGLTQDGAGLHCANSQGYNVVNWSITADASRWYLQEVTLTEEEMAEMKEIYDKYTADKAIVSNITTKRTTYNAVLKTIFTDLSCSELNDEYKNASDDELRAALSELPEALQDMALRVKSGVWEADKDDTYNNYVKNFRIAEYEPYSDRDAWKTITKVGPFAELTNPTGITVKAGEIVYIYLDSSAKTGSKIILECAKGTEHTGTTMTLKEGVNAWHATVDGELFIGYIVTDTKKYCVATADHAADYANINVHIEGGHATGMWDMHRGMDVDDWDYLSKNMFGAEYLHVKGESTMLSLVTSKVKGAPKVDGIMKIWDFIFETQERLIGNDGQWDGRYRPVISPRDVNASINPNWGGNCGTNHPNISRDYLFNFEKMVKDTGHLWEIYHEEGHAHQYPINMAATTESSNNGYAQMTNYEFGSYNSRNKGIETLITFKNNGWGWVDILRGGEGTSRSNGFEYYDQSLWLQCHMFFQLYLYFHVQGYDPDFWPRVADAMRTNGGIKLHGNQPNNPTLYYEDYLKFAETCAEVSQTDLYEFFDTWGFFGYYDEVKVGNNYDGFKSKDNASAGIRFVGDYGSYYLKMPVRDNATDEKRLTALKEKMQAMTKKAPGIMFIDDHIKDMTITDTCFVATIYPSLVGKTQAYYGVTKGTSGNVGMFTEFDGTDRSGEGIYYTISTTRKVTIHGTGYVGIKIYNADHRIIRIYNTTTFTLDKEIADGLANGTYTMVAPLGNAVDVIVGRDKIYDSIHNVQAAAGAGRIYDLMGRSVSRPQPGQTYIIDGKRTIIK